MSQESQIGKFFTEIGRVIGFVIIIITFTAYFVFREYFEGLPKYIVGMGSIAVLSIGVILILYRNASRLNKSNLEITEEKVVHITPMDEFKHDILALLAFSSVIVWVLFSGDDVNVNDLAQAGIAYLSVALVRRIYKERLY